MGRAADDDGFVALMTVVQLIPQEDCPRLMLAQELIRRGGLRDARIILRPLAYSPHESGSSRQARKLLDEVKTLLGLN